MQRRRTAKVIAGLASLTFLAACGGGTTAGAAPRHVVEFPAGGPTEVTTLDAATLLPGTPCTPEQADDASCTVVSAVTPGDGDALAAVIRTSRGGITTFVLAGRDDHGTAWSHAPEAAPPACIGGPGPERFACLTTTPDGSTWVVYDVTGGAETYRVDQPGAVSPPVVTPGAETVYSVWAGGSPEEAQGTVLALGPDRTRWSTPVTFTVPAGSPSDPGYVMERDGTAVVTGAGISSGSGDREWRRLTLDASTGAEQDGLPGIALIDMNGLGLARDSEVLLAGEVVVSAPSDAVVAQPAAVGDPLTLPVTVLLPDGRLAAYSPEDGGLLWETAGPFNPWAACEGVLVGADGGALSAVDLLDGAERWVVADAVGQVSFAWCAPEVAVILDGGRLAGFSLSDGSLAWEVDLGLAAGAEAVALRPAGAGSDSMTLLVLGGGTAADGTPVNQLLTIR